VSGTLFGAPRENGENGVRERTVSGTLFGAPRENGVRERCQERVKKLEFGPLSIMYIVENPECQNC